MHTPSKSGTHPIPVEVREDPEDEHASATVRTRRVSGRHRFARIQRRTRKAEAFDPNAADPSPTPIELALSALGAGQETIYRVFAEHMEVPLNGVEVVVTGDLDIRGLSMPDDEEHPRFDSIDVHITLDSPASPDDLQRLVDTVTVRCPVLNLYHTGTTVNLTISHTDTCEVQ